jgi:hypothetical protein
MSGPVPSEFFLGALIAHADGRADRAHSDPGAAGHATLPKHPRYFINAVFTCHSQVFFKAQSFEYFYFLLFGANLGPTCFPSPRLAFYEVIGKNGVQSGNVMSCCRCSDRVVNRSSEINKDSLGNPESSISHIAILLLWPTTMVLPRPSCFEGFVDDPLRILHTPHA